MAGQNVTAATPKTEDEIKAIDALAGVHKRLLELGYSQVKAGAINVPGFGRVQTWIKRTGTVYLIWNEAGQWDLLRSTFGSADPDPAKIDA